jgi:hypothetical protein
MGPDQMSMQHPKEKILDKSKNEAYFRYLRQLEEDKFCGKVTIQFFQGGISKVHKIFEPIIITEEDVVLKKEKI